MSAALEDGRAIAHDRALGRGATNIEADYVLDPVLACHKRTAKGAENRA